MCRISKKTKKNLMLYVCRISKKTKKNLMLYMCRISKKKVNATCVGLVKKQKRI